MATAKKKTTKKAAKPKAKKTVKKATKPKAKKTVKKTTKKAAKPAAKKAAKPAAKKPVKKATKPAAKPAAKPAVAPSPAPKIKAWHVVTSQDTASSITQKYYGSSDQAKWMAVYEINKAVIGADPNQIRPGLLLRIPE